MKKPFLATFIAIAMSVFGQDDLDALRISSTDILGTARSMGVGNAFSAVGADISNININPASIGRYSSNEAALTIGVPINIRNSSYNLNNTENRNVGFNFQSFGAIFSNNDKPQKINVGIAVNRLAGFKEIINNVGYNPNNSLLIKYAEDLEGVSATSAASDYPFDYSLAYVTKLLIKDTLVDEYYPVAYNNVQQQVKLERSGGIDEAALAVSVEVHKKLNLGIGVGIPIANYNETYFYKEDDINDSFPQFIFFDKTSRYDYKGYGMNLKLGFHAQPTKNIRLAASFISPSIYFMNSNFAVDFTADYDSSTFIPETQISEFKYKFISPMKWTTGAAFVHPKYGFVSFEYEGTMIDKGKFRFDENFDPSDSYQNTVNNSVNEKYKTTHTFKFGLEALVKNLRLRGGVNYKTTPFDKDIVTTKKSSLSYHGGIGFRKESWIFDMAYKLSKGNETVVPYTLKFEQTPNLEISKTTHNIALSVGYKF